MQEKVNEPSHGPTEIKQLYGRPPTVPVTYGEFPKVCSRVIPIFFVSHTCFLVPAIKSIGLDLMCDLNPQRK